MQCALTLLVLLGLAVSARSVPLPNFGGRVNQVRDALEHINKVRSALRRSLDVGETEENSQARSVVRGLELSGRGLLANAMETVQRSAELAKRHVELNKRDQGKEVFRKTAENIKRAAENLKMKRACGAGLGFCDPNLEETKREEEAMQLRNVGLLSEAWNTVARSAQMAKRHAELQERSNDDEVKRAVGEVAGKLAKAADEVKRKRAEQPSGGFLQHTMDMIKKSVDLARRHAEEEEMEKRSDDEKKRAFEEVAGKIEKVANEMKRKRAEQPSGGFLQHTVDMIKKSVDLARRHAEEEEMKKRSSGGFLQHTMDMIKKSADLARRHVEEEEQKKRDTEEVENALKEFRKRACGIGLGFCGPETMDVRRGLGEQEVLTSELQSRHIEEAKREEEEEEEDEEEEEEEEEERSLFSLDGFKRALNTLKERRELAEEKRAAEEGKRALRDLADKIKAAASKLEEKKRSENEVTKKFKRWCTSEGFCQEDDSSPWKRALEAVKTMAARHVEQQKRESNMKVLRSVADNLKRAAEKIKQERDTEEAMKEFQRRACGAGLGFCAPQAEQESKRNIEDDFPRMFRRNPVVASKSAIKDMKKKDSDANWVRKVREVLDNKAAQIRASIKRIPAARAVLGA